MAFKTDTIRLKNFANDGAVTGEAQGELAVVSNVLKYYNGSAWNAIDVSSAIVLSNFNAGVVETAGQFTDSDTKIMSSAAIDDRINGKFSNVVKHDAWNAAVTIENGLNIINAVYYNTTAQGSTHALKIHPPTSYPANARVEVINGSSATMYITRNNTGADAQFRWQANGGLQNQIDIGIGQRAVFLKTAAANWDVIVLSL